MTRTLRSKLIRIRTLFFLMLFITIVLSYLFIDAKMKLNEISDSFPMIVGGDIRKGEYLDSLDTEVKRLEIDIFELRAINLNYRLGYENLKINNPECANLFEQYINE